MCHWGEVLTGMLSILSQLSSEYLEQIELRLIFADYECFEDYHPLCPRTFWPTVANALGCFSRLKTIVIEPLITADIEAIRRDLRSIELHGTLTVRASSAADDTYYANDFKLRYY